MAGARGTDFCGGLGLKPWPGLKPKSNGNQTRKQKKKPMKYKRPEEDEASGCFFPFPHERESDMAAAVRQRHFHRSFRSTSKPRLLCLLLQRRQELKHARAPRPFAPRRPRQPRSLPQRRRIIRPSSLLPQNIHVHNAQVRPPKRHQRIHARVIGSHDHTRALLPLSFHQPHDILADGRAAAVSITITIAMNTPIPMIASSTPPHVCCCFCCCCRRLSLFRFRRLRLRLRLLAPLPRCPPRGRRRGGGRRGGRCLRLRLCCCCGGGGPTAVAAAGGGGLLRRFHHFHGRFFLFLLLLLRLGGLGLLRRGLAALCVYMCACVCVRLWDGVLAAQHRSMERQQGIGWSDLPCRLHTLGGIAPAG